MTYTEFIEDFRNNFCAHTDVSEEQLRFYPDGWRGSGSLYDNEFIQNTNHLYDKEDSDSLAGDYLVIEDGGKSFGSICRFSLEYLYEEFQEDGWDRVWYIVDENLRFRDKCSIVELFGDEATYESVKSKLIIRPINFSDNRYELRRACYHRIGDIALVLYAISFSGEYSGEDTLATVKVPREILERWGTDADTAIYEALLNTYITRPPRIYFKHTELVDPPYERGAFMALGADFHIANPTVTPTLTTYPNTNGAIAMFYPGVAKKLAEVMGGSYYVSFTSIHEARLHLKGSMKPRDILHALKSVNDAFDPNEILTRKVYFYDAERDLLKPLEL